MCVTKVAPLVLLLAHCVAFVSGMSNPDYLPNIDEIPAQPLLSLDLRVDSWSDKDIEAHLPNVCNDMTSGTGERTPLLAIGITKHRLVLLTTDLFLFDLPASMLDDSMPPYQVLVDRKPVHLSRRWPTAYAAVKSIAHSILHTGVTSCTLINDGKVFHNQEYLLFVYAANETACSLAVDLERDNATQGPCDPQWKQAGALISVFQTNFPFLAPFLTGPPEKMQMWQGEFVRSDQHGPPGPCTDFGPECLVYLAPPQAPPVEAARKKSSLSFAQPVVTGLIDINANKMYVIDAQHTVHVVSQKRTDALKPLKEFIGCNPKRPFKLSFTKNTWILIGCIFAVVQILIIVACAVIAYNWPDESENADLEVVREKKRKTLGGHRTSAKESKDKSRSSKSRKSVSRKSISRKSVSRKSVSRGSSKHRSKSPKNSISSTSSSASKQSNH